MADFLNMGGYASYVWGSYGLTALALVVLAVLSLKANADAKAQVDVLRPKRKRRTADGEEAA